MGSLVTCRAANRLWAPSVILISLCACRGPSASSDGEPLDESGIPIVLERVLTTGRAPDAAESGEGELPSDSEELSKEEEARFLEALEEAYGSPPAAAEEQEPELATDIDDLIDFLAEDQDEQDVEPISPYEEFGERIVWYRDAGLIMKPFTFPLGAGKRVQDLIVSHSGLDVFWAPVDEEVLPEESKGEQPPGSVVLHLLNGQEAEAYTPPRVPGVTAPKVIPLADWLVVTAAPKEMRQVQRFIRTFVSNAHQIQVEAKIVELTTTQTFDYGIRPVDGVTPIFGLPNASALIHTVDFSFGNTVGVGEAIFGVSAVFDGVQFNALLEMIATDESASIISQPKVAVREGARAELVEIEQVPVATLGAIAANGTFTWTNVFKEVGVQLYVVPRVVGHDTLMLDVDVEVSQITGTAVTFILTDSSGATSTVGVPESAKSTATTTVRLKAGEGLVIGGLISERTLDRERKVPLLGDIPLLGSVFKSHYQVTERTDVLFFIYPRILQGIDLNSGF